VEAEAPKASVEAKRKAGRKNRIRKKAEGRKGQLSLLAFAFPSCQPKGAFGSHQGSFSPIEKQR
jgi:hypothetical protein